MNRGKGITVVVTVLLVGMIAAAWLSGLRLHINRTTVAVGPSEAIQLLGYGSLEEIQDAVGRSGCGVDDIQLWDGSLLFWAVDAGRQDVVEWLLTEGANPNGLAPDMNPLKRALYKRDVALVALLLRRGADPDAPLTYDRTPRTVAQQTKDAAILSLFDGAATRAETRPDMSKQGGSRLR